MTSDFSYPFLIGDLIVNDNASLYRVVNYLPDNKIAVISALQVLSYGVWFIDSSEFWQWTYAPENPDERDIEETLNTLREQEEKHREQLLIQKAFLVSKELARRASVA